MIINKTWPQIHHLGIQWKASVKANTAEAGSSAKFSGDSFGNSDSHVIVTPTGVHQQNKSKNRTGPRRAREALGRQNNSVSWYTLQHELPDWDI